MTDQIRLPIVQNDAKLKQRLQFLTEKGSSIGDFVGSEDIESLFFIYLLKKYKSDCFIGVGKEITGVGVHNIRLLGLTLLIGNETDIARTREDYLRLCTYLAEQVVTCIRSGSNVIVIPVNMTFLKYNDDGTNKIEGGYNKTSGHANVLIYRRKFNHIEHYDPHGQNFEVDPTKHDTRAIQSMMTQFISAINEQLHINSLPPVTLLRTHETCPLKLGFQAFEGRSKLKKDEAKEPNGYCAAWAMFFTELVLKNPDVPFKELQKKVFQIIGEKKTKEDLQNDYFFDYLRVLIRGYANVIDEKITKYFSTQFGEPITVAKLRNYHTHNIPRYNEIISRLNELINLEVRLFGANRGNYLNKLKYQISITEEEMDKITSVKRKKSIEFMPRVYPKYLSLKNELDVLNAQLRDLTTSNELNYIKHSSSSSVNDEVLDRFLLLDFPVQPKSKSNSSRSNSNSSKSRSKSNSNSSSNNSHTKSKKRMRNSFSSRSKSSKSKSKSNDSLFDLIEEVGPPP